MYTLNRLRIRLMRYFINKASFIGNLDVYKTL
jgi:hypothetical protein